MSTSVVFVVGSLLLATLCKANFTSVSPGAGSTSPISSSQEPTGGQALAENTGPRPDGEPNYADGAEAEGFARRPHDANQSSTTSPAPVQRDRDSECNCSGNGNATASGNEKLTESGVLRLLLEMAQDCLPRGPDERRGGASPEDWSRQLYDALTDLTTVLKRFQSPALPVPGSLIYLPKDCAEVLSRGATTSGIYTIQTLDAGRPFQVYCDMETDGGGWTVFQKRQDGSVDFFRGFATYRRGFGSLAGEFWLGNDLIHRLTTQDEYHLRVDLGDFEDRAVFADYGVFRVADASEDFQLTVGSYQGTAGDALSPHNGQPFTAKDRDNDNWSGKNCATEYRGAWWYNSCYHASLNGEYLRGTSESYGTGIVWYQWHGYYYSLKRTEMKIRPAD